MPRTAHALQERRDRAGRADLADEVHSADVDPQLEGCRRDQRFELAFLQERLRFQALFPRQAAVVRRHLVRAETFGEMQGQAFRESPGVDEDERRPVLSDELHQSLVDLLPHLRGHDRLERRRRDLDGQIERARVSRIDNAGVGCWVSGAGKERGYVLDGLLCRRQADPLQAPAGEVLQPLERQRQVAPSLVAGHRVDLVHDDSAHRAQHLARALRREDEIERLGRGDEDVGGAPYHLLPLRPRRVAGAHQRANLDIGQAQLLEHAPDLDQRLGQILLDVVRKRLERRDVHHLRPIGQSPGETLPQQRIDRGQERRERLARPGRRGNQRVLAGLDQRPGTLLRLGGRGKPGPEPTLHGGMKARQRHTEIWRRFTEGATPLGMPRSARSSPRSCCSASTLRRSHR